MSTSQLGMRTRTVVAISALLLIAMLMVAAQSSTSLESGAVGTLRSINAAQATYTTKYSDNGYACDLATLGPDPKSGPPSLKFAGLIANSLASGREHNGYVFKLECAGNSKLRTEYRVSALPVRKGSGRVFCSDQTGSIKTASGDAQSCFTSGVTVR